MIKYVFEILEEVGKQRTREEKVKILKENESWALKDVIRGSLDSTIVWNLPEGAPPYRASAAHNHPANLLRENKKFRYSPRYSKSEQQSNIYEFDSAYSKNRESRSVYDKSNSWTEARLNSRNRGNCLLYTSPSPRDRG